MSEPRHGFVDPLDLLIRRTIRAGAVLIGLHILLVLGGIYLLYRFLT